MMYTYNGGYKKAVLDLKNRFEKDKWPGYTVNQIHKIMMDTLNMLLTDPQAMNAFMENGGECVLVLCPDKKGKYTELKGIY